MTESLPIAVDIALIPDARLADDAVQMNRELLVSMNGEIRLSETPSQGHGLPHVSLAMFFIQQEVAEACLPRLQALMAEEKTPLLTPSRISSRKNVHGSTTWSIDIEKSDTLLALHRRVMEEFADWSGNPGDSSSFFGDVDTARTSDADWIHSFSDQAAFENFDPHITLGFGPANVDFKASPSSGGYAATIGLFHLGAGCTCRKVIHQIDLSGPVDGDEI